MHPEPINPRVLRFLSAHDLPARTLTRDEHGGVRRVALGTVSLPWTIHFMCWIQLQWQTWARELGFRNADEARLAGHGHKAFDTWLDARLEAR